MEGTRGTVQEREGDRKGSKIERRNSKSLTVSGHLGLTVRLCFIFFYYYHIFIFLSKLNVSCSCFSLLVFAMLNIK